MDGRQDFIEEQIRPGSIRQSQWQGEKEAWSNYCHFGLRFVQTLRRAHEPIYIFY